MFRDISTKDLAALAQDPRFKLGAPVFGQVYIGEVHKGDEGFRIAEVVALDLSRS